MSIESFSPSHFVGSSEMVRQIQAQFVDYFPAGGTVADVGCGVGVFLELLQASGRTGVGVDITDTHAAALRSQGFEFHHQDVMTFLQKHPVRYDGIFASHLIEHLPAPEGLKLLDLMHDSLKPGGVIVVITPSFHDLGVSGERFWLDISHVRPYPLLLLRALFEHLHIEILASGYDTATRFRPELRHPRRLVRHWIKRLRFGALYDVGDTYIVGRKDAACSHSQ